MPKAVNQVTQGVLGLVQQACALLPCCCNVAYETSVITAADRGQLLQFVYIVCIFYSQNKLISQKLDMLLLKKKTGTRMGINFTTTSLKGC